MINSQTGNKALTPPRKGRMTPFLSLLCLLGLSNTLVYADDYGKAYVDNHPDSFLYINPNLATWPNNQVDVLINTNGHISASQLSSYLSLAFAKYQQRADIAFNLTGETPLDLLPSYNSSRLGTVIVEVMNNSEMDTYVSALTSGSVTNGSSFGGYAWMWWGSSLLAGQIALNADYLTNEECWKGIVTHELGHILNLDHSDTQDSIMFAAPYNSCEFQQTLRYDDITAPHAMYPKNEPNYEVTVMENGCLYFPNLEYQGVNYQVRELCVFQVDGNAVITNPQ